MQTRLIWITPDAERVIAYCARVSSSHQENPDYAPLLRYCMRHGHWSIFEMASACFEIVTSRAISAQIIRHRSFSFQEFSLRYASAVDVEPVVPRQQAAKNRQSSTDTLDADTQAWFAQTVDHLNEQALAAYQQALDQGVARESARFLLPLATQTRLYMAGTIRSWIHYLALRCAADTQHEHRAIALAIRAELTRLLPVTADAAGWPQDIHEENESDALE